jgi:hypothetical protein
VRASGGKAAVTRAAQVGQQTVGCTSSVTIGVIGGRSPTWVVCGGAASGRVGARVVAHGGQAVGWRGAMASGSRRARVAPG